LIYPIADALPINNPCDPVPFHIGHGPPKMPTPPSGDPAEAIDVHAEVRTLLIAASCALNEQVPFGSGILLNCPNTNGISDVCVGPRNCKTAPLRPSSQPQVVVYASE
jgi:hypothetical protein